MPTTRNVNSGEWGKRRVGQVEQDFAHTPGFIRGGGTRGTTGIDPQAGTQDARLWAWELIRRNQVAGEFHRRRMLYRTLMDKMGCWNVDLQVWCAGIGLILYVSTR